MNQLRLKRANDNERLIIAKVNGKVCIRTYTFKAIKRFKGDTGYHLLVFEGVRIVQQGWSWNLEDTMQWLEARTGGLSID